MYPFARVALPLEPISHVIAARQPVAIRPLQYQTAPAEARRQLVRLLKLALLVIEQHKDASDLTKTLPAFLNLLSKIISQPVASCRSFCYTLRQQLTSSCHSKGGAYHDQP